MSGEAYGRDLQFAENEWKSIGNSQRLWTEDNAQIKMVSAIRSGLGMIIDKVHISWYLESSESGLSRAENASYNDNADTCPLKQVLGLSKCLTQYYTTTDYGCEDILQFD